MYNLLCYGDSNTWGCIPGTDRRYPKTVRWPGILEDDLGEEYLVIEEGLNGRTTVWEDPIEGHKSGKNYLKPCLESHKPLDLVIIMLGTNDLKGRFSVPACDVAEGAGTLAEIVFKSGAGRNNESPDVLLIAPPPIGDLGVFAPWYEGAKQKSKKLGDEFARVSEERGCFLVNAADHIESSDVDGVHLDETQHKKLGLAVAETVRNINYNRDDA